MSYYTANQALYWDGTHLTSAYTGRRALNAGDVVPDGEVSRDGLDTAGLVTLQSGGVPSRSGADVLEIWQSSRAYLAGQEILDPTGVTILVRKADGTSRSTYDATEQALWSAAGASGASLPSQTGNAGKYLTTDGSAAAWGTVATGLTPTAVKTANYTAAAGDLVPVDTTSGNVTVTLPTAPADKTQVGVKHVIRGGTNTVSIACGGSDVFNKTGGSTTATLTLLNQGALLQYKASGAVWYVVSDDLALSQLDLRFAPANAAEVVQSVTATTTTTPISIASGSIVNLTLNASTTLSLSTPTAGQSFTLQSTNGGAFTLAFGSNVKWAGGTPGAVTSGAGKIDAFTFFSVDGVNWLGGTVGKAFA